MISTRIRFEIAFAFGPAPVVDVWHTLTICLKAAKCLPKSFFVSQIAGHEQKIRSEVKLKLTPNEIGSLIESRELSGFQVYTGHTDKSIAFDLMQRQSGHTRLNCRIESKAKAPDDWTLLIEGIMTQWPCIGSWQWNHAYLCWQRYCIVEGYERFNGPVPHGAKRYMDKGLFTTSPDREMIDVSLNPGRTKEIVSGIHFTPSAEMWLGSHFWQYAKCTKEEAMAADFFFEVRDTPHFLYLKSWTQPFTRPDGEQGRQQQRIWKLFFHEDCEWPPGSGTIWDEPMYGPPELMP